MPGTWLAYTYADSDGLVTGPGAGAEQALLGPVAVDEDGPRPLVFGNTMVIGLGFVPDSASSNTASRALADTPSTVSLGFPNPTDPPAASNPSARICYWWVIVRGTGEIVMVDQNFLQPPVPVTGPGFGVGQSRTRTIRQRTYTATLVDRGGGQRALEVTSIFHNRFVLQFLVCNRDGTNATIHGDAQGGCADETCTDVRYDGAIYVVVTTGSTRGAAALADIVGVRDTLRSLTGGGNRVLLTAVQRTPNGQYVGIIAILSVEERSTQTLTALLPSEWVKSATDRHIFIQLPTPAPTPGPPPRASILGDWRGEMEITNNSGGSTTCDKPHCAGLTVEKEGSGLRIWYCNGVESFCDGSAKTQQCALQFTATASGAGFSGTGVDNNAPCCIGCVGQNRVYGCGINATFTVDPTGQQTLEGDFNGAVTFCPSDPSAADGLNTHFKFCRPNPCPVSPPPPPPPDD